jgi:hypothetical protein
LKSKRKKQAAKGNPILPVVAVLLIAAVGFGVWRFAVNVGNLTGGTATPSQTLGATATPQLSPAPVVGSITEYFPIRANTRSAFEGKGNEYASFSVYIDYASQTRVQQRLITGGTEIVRVIEVKDGKAVLVYEQGESYARENMLQKDDMADVLLMEPLRAGTSWTLGDGRKRSITDTAAKVVTKAGTYAAIEVTTADRDGTQRDYYAKNVGLVKSVFVSDGDEVSSSLAKTEVDVALVQTVRFYFPGAEGNVLLYSDKEIAFKTNDVTRIALAKAYKATANTRTLRVFSEDTLVNSLYLGKDGIVMIDLSKAFQTGMNAGAAAEAAMLRCVANTFAGYYGAQSILLTIDAKLYASGHTELKRGETIRADITGAIKMD